MEPTGLLALCPSLSSPTTLESLQPCPDLPPFLSNPGPDPAVPSLLSCAPTALALKEGEGQRPWIILELHPVPCGPHCQCSDISRSQPTLITRDLPWLGSSQPLQTQTEVT